MRERGGVLDLQHHTWNYKRKGNDNPGRETPGVSEILM